MIDSVLTNNIGSIVTAGLFIWYMGKRDKMIQDTFNTFTDKIGHLAQAIEGLDRRLKAQEAVTRFEKREAKSEASV